MDAGNSTGIKPRSREFVTDTEKASVSLPDADFQSIRIHRLLLDFLCTYD